MSQWGSKSLADQGYTATEILRYYYGDNIYINSAEEISGIPSSWPGYDLDIGATGPKVEQMQEQEKLQRQLQQLRARMKKEKNLAKQMELRREIKRLENNPYID